MLPTFYVVDPRIDRHALPDTTALDLPHAGRSPRRNRPAALCLAPARPTATGAGLVPTGRTAPQGGGFGRLFARLLRRKPGDGTGNLAPVRL